MSSSKLVGPTVTALVAAMGLVLAGCSVSTVQDQTMEGRTEGRAVEVEPSATAEGSTDAAPPAEPPVVEVGDSPTYEVWADADSDVVAGMFLAFFPSRLVVHPGSAVSFRRPENGEPHTVTFGTGIPTNDIRLPGGNFYSGGHGNQPRVDASTPCFLSEGVPSTVEGCPAEQRQAVPFDGTASWFNSGGLLGSEDYIVQLSDDIEPGTYQFVCLVHTTEMKGTLEVVAPDQPADEPAEVVARGDQEFDELVEDLPLDEPDGSRASEEDEVLAGLPVPGARFLVWAFAFLPEEVEVPVGGTLTWDAGHQHTISFNAPEDARPLYERDSEGAVTENPLALVPNGDPAAWDGTGFLNSGVVGSVGRDGRYSVTFTEPGTYTYQCLIHFDMEGRVKVGDVDDTG